MYHPLGEAAYRKGYQNGDPTFYNDFHRGADMILDSGNFVYAMDDSVVDKVYHGQGGLTVCLKNAKYYFRYMHLNEAKVKEGDKVKEQQVIGISGGHPDHPNAGLSTAPHLHIDVSHVPFDLYNTSNFINPYELLNKPTDKSYNININEVKQRIAEMYLSIYKVPPRMIHIRYEQKRILANKPTNSEKKNRLERLRNVYVAARNNEDAEKDYIKHHWNPYSYVWSHGGLRHLYGIKNRKQVSEVVEQNWGDIIRHYIDYGIPEDHGDELTESVK